ncbi:Protein of unknown function (DUF2910) [Rivularia sp. PCC 7116]|uniref:GAP family protein n=1 Tax=Rivularia sp. PCC 7116 TaxID=373994 RepID=UPI00029F3D48|nr:GAP family protein [Rivularia sp. PCC 7116]AFY54603.1 Protein of unknown function (DUF2910) [Rivularia sp. PCC 7116]
MLTLKIFWLAIIDSVNPTIIAIAIVLLICRGVRAIRAYTISVFATTVVQAFTVYFGLDKLLHQISWQNIFGGEWLLMLLGLGIIFYGLNGWKYRHEMPNTQKWHLSASSPQRINYIKYIIIAGATTLLETPTAFLLFIAVLEVQKSSANLIFASLYFCLYSFVYTLPIILITLLSIWQEKQLKIWLSSKLNNIFIGVNILFCLSLIAIGIFIFATGVIVLGSKFK